MTSRTTDDVPIAAAGVALLRDGALGREVALIHRPVRKDWSLPKGKVDPGEHIVAAAVRECDEETGLVPILGAPLTRQSYPVAGRSKTVDYWVASIGREEGFTPDDEVDEVRWFGIDEAVARLTYPRDGQLLRQAAALPPTSPLILLRHTQAMKRLDFHGTQDANRPLSGKGRTQAKALVPLLAAYGITDVRSSDSARCMETVKRYAKSIDTKVTAEPALSEEGHEEHPKRAAKRMQALMCDPTPLVVCSHRPVLPTLASSLATMPSLGPMELDPRLPPGGFLVVHRAFAEDSEPTIVAIERHML